jgi:hypothetical protein
MGDLKTRVDALKVKELWSRAPERCAARNSSRMELK